MKKYILFILIITISVVLLYACGNENHEVYSEEEISRAIEKAKAEYEFHNTYTGDTLIDIEYDKESTETDRVRYANQFGEDEAIILKATILPKYRTGEETWYFVLTKSYTDEWTFQMSTFYYED